MQLHQSVAVTAAVAAVVLLVFNLTLKVFASSFFSLHHLAFYFFPIKQLKIYFRSHNICQTFAKNFLQKEITFQKNIYIENCQLNVKQFIGNC